VSQLLAVPVLITCLGDITAAGKWCDNAISLLHG
jgi:hypothetical protein